MVSQFAAATQVKVQRSAHGGVFAPPPAKIISIQITWGRRSLFAAPQKRSCTIDCLIPISEVAAGGRYWPGSPIEVIHDGDDIFAGHVTDFIPIRYNSTHHRVKIQCVETYGRSTLLGIKVTTNARNARFLELTMRGQTGYTPPIMPEKVPENMAFDRSGVDAQEITLYDGFGALAAARPLSFPIWEPDYKTVRPSIYQPVRRALYSVEAHEVIAGLPTYSLAEQPAQLVLTSGGVFGRKNQRFSGQTSLGGKGFSPAAEVNCPFAVETNAWTSAQTQAALRLVNLQVTAPMQFTFSDSHLGGRFNNLFPMFFTYENPQTAWRARGYTLPDLGREPIFVNIGGTLTITRRDTRHQVTAIHAA